MLCLLGLTQTKRNTIVRRSMEVLGIELNLTEFKKTLFFLQTGKWNLSATEAQGLTEVTAYITQLAITLEQAAGEANDKESKGREGNEEGEVEEAAEECLQREEVPQ